MAHVILDVSPSIALTHRCSWTSEMFVFSPVCGDFDLFFLLTFRQPPADSHEASAREDSLKRVCECLCVRACKRVRVRRQTEKRNAHKPMELSTSPLWSFLRGSLLTLTPSPPSLPPSLMQKNMIFCFTRLFQGWIRVTTSMTTHCTGWPRRFADFFLPGRLQRKNNVLLNPASTSCDSHWSTLYDLCTTRTRELCPLSK